MYLRHFGLKEKPFEITVDPRFLYLSETHKEALAHLVYAVQEKKGFAVITGDAGTGKTTLVQSLLGRLDGNTHTAFIFNPRMENNSEFLRSICEDLEIQGEKGNKVDCLTRLNQFLLDCFGRKENVVVIIDEAHTLSPELLEEIRLLTNLETPSHKLLQVMLLGQPELDRMLSQPRFLALKQRINVRYRLQVLSQKETAEYIIRRLRVAGARTTRLFTAGALKKVYRYSGGIPRVINIVCDNALTNGYAEEKKSIDAGVIREAISDLEGESSENWSRMILLAGGAAALIFFLGALYFYGPPEMWEIVESSLGRVWQFGKTAWKGFGVLHDLFRPLSGSFPFP
jgi:general secretion pathway protein A